MSHRQPHGQSIEGVSRGYTAATLPTALALYQSGGLPGTRYITSDDGVIHTLVLVNGTPALIIDDSTGLIPGPATLGTSSGALTVSGFSSLTLTTANGQAANVVTQPGNGVPATGATPGTVPGSMQVRGGVGGVAGTGTGAGGAGSTVVVAGGVGGAGTATGLPGAGGNVSITSGAAGANGGAAGAVNAGNVTVDSGAGSGGGTGGTVTIGGANATQVNIGKAGTPTLLGGAVAVTSTGAVPNAAAAIDVVSTTQGLLFPRMSTTQKNAIAAPPAGLVVYDLTLNKLCVRTAAAWETITSA